MKKHSFVCSPVQHIEINIASMYLICFLHQSFIDYYYFIGSYYANVGYTRIYGIRNVAGWRRYRIDKDIVGRFSFTVTDNNAVVYVDIMKHYL